MESYSGYDSMVMNCHDYGVNDDELSFSGERCLVTILCLVMISDHIGYSDGWRCTMVE